jgi:uncharacterized protein (TIGR03435 family)
MTKQFAIKLCLAAGAAARMQSPAQTPTAATAPRPAFEVVSVKPNHSASGGVMIRMAPGGRFNAENITVKFLLEEAYRVKENQISGAPGWLDTERFDIEAKPDGSFAAGEQKGNPQEQHKQLMLMLQSMLEDRFKLVLHHETKELPVYALVVAKSGPKLHESAPEPPGTSDDDPPPGPMKPDGPQPRHSIRMMGRGDLNINAETLDTLADVLSQQLGRLIVNKTGLKGNYDFSLKWTPDEHEGQMFGGAGGGPDGRPGPPPADASGPSIYAALQEQLGLKLETQKGPVDTIVIDRVEKPSEN